MNENKLFRTFYKRLLNSETTYYMNVGSGSGGSGSFDPSTNDIHFTDDYSLVQEAFHAYQQDLGVYTSSDLSVREAEGDIVSTNIILNLGQISMTHSWDQGINWNGDFNDNEYSFGEKVLTKDFDQIFSKTVDARIKLYRDREKRGIPSGPTYRQSNSGQSTLALKKVVMESMANENKLIGPRLPNGEFYD